MNLGVTKRERYMVLMYRATQAHRKPKTRLGLRLRRGYYAKWLIRLLQRTRAAA